MEASGWDWVSEMFERLLDGEDLDNILALQEDADIRAHLAELWHHHLQALDENFFDNPVQIDVMPVFDDGQVLLGRFRIKQLLGSGGMGEVYLAFDSTLQELVALKTIPRLLAPSPAIRQRFAMEVQSARRVAHRNICRIYDLFEDGDTVFFSMEYVEGTLLQELLSAPGGFLTKHANCIALQLAEGLQAAHRSKVVHGDFKPGNVMVADSDPPRAVIMDFGLARALDRKMVGGDGTLSAQAGTVDYMAPELRQGGDPTVLSDIYAYGKVLRELVPLPRLYADCLQANPRAREGALESIIQHLSPPPSRRWLLAAAGFGTVGIATYFLKRPPALSRFLPSGARLLVNGFVSAAEVSVARLARGILITALQQSPIVGAVADQDLLRLARQLDAVLPLAGQKLIEIMTHLRAGFWLDSELTQSGNRYSLRARLYRLADRQIVGEAAFRDSPTPAALAARAAVWLREGAGESKRSLEANPVNVPHYTTEIPEALDKYYEAMEHFAQADLERSIPLLREAVRLDPNFAQAHSSLGSLLRTQGQEDQGFLEAELGMQKSAGLPEREKARIETVYYWICEDHARMLEVAAKNLNYFPDEPRSYRIYAALLAKSGRETESIFFNRKALGIAPADELLRSELIYNLCFAGDFEAALQEFRILLDRGFNNPYIYSCGGLACLGLGRFEEALQYFERENTGTDKANDLICYHTFTGGFEAAAAQATEDVGGAESMAVHYRNLQSLCGVSFLMDRLDLARQQLARLPKLPSTPNWIWALDGTAFWAARLGDRKTLDAVGQQVAQIADRWPSSPTKAVEEHLNALQLWLSGRTAEAEAVLLAAVGRAYNVAARFDLACIHAALGKYDLAEHSWMEMEKHLGLTLYLWFPSAVLLAWAQRALVAQAGNHPSTARLYAQKLLGHIGRKNPRLQIVRLAETILNNTQNG